MPGRNATREICAYAIATICCAMASVVFSLSAASQSVSPDARLRDGLFAAVTAMFSFGFLVGGVVLPLFNENSSDHSENSAAYAASYSQGAVFLSFRRLANTASSTLEEQEPLLSSGVPDASSPSSPLPNPA